MAQRQSDEKKKKSTQIEVEKIDGQKKSVAFALGGLAGNNAHGAGFLQAALDRDIKPIMISCTSGQILWVSRYLQIANGRIKTNLRNMLQEDIFEMNPTGNINLDFIRLILFGKPQVFAPAYLEYIRDMGQNSLDVWYDMIRNAKVSIEKAFSLIFKEDENGSFIKNIFLPYFNENIAPFFPKLTAENNPKKQKQVLLMQAFLELFPCRTLIPDFSSEFFEAISDNFNSASLLHEKEVSLAVGIIFNSYNPQSGKEYVYLNESARKFLQDKSSDEEHKYEPRQSSEHRKRTTYQKIDKQAVRDALWIYQYGFEKKGSGFVDGAYFRDIILSELSVADRIFCVRPINHRWQGDMPWNYIELEDLKTEIGFDGAYCGELYKIELINKLVKRLNEASGNQFHHIDLQELEIRRPRGYYDYLYESMDVFDDAYEDAMKLFDELGYPAAQTKSGTYLDS